MTAKVRPCLVLSIPIEDVDRALVTVVPHTTSGRGTRFECDVKVPFLKPGVFDAQGLVTIPVPKAIRRLGALRPDGLQVIEPAVCRWLGLPRS